MDPIRVAVRCVVAFVYLLAMLRMSGKKLISQSTTFDFVLALILGDLIDDFLFAEVAASEFVVAVSVLVGVDLIVKIIGYKYDFFNYLVDGRPSIMIQTGTEQKFAMKRELLSRSDLLALLRLKGCDEQKQDQIEKAILEDSGHLSVLEKQEYKSVKKKEKKNLRKETK